MADLVALDEVEWVRQLQCDLPASVSKDINSITGVWAIFVIPFSVFHCNFYINRLLEAHFTHITPPPPPLANALASKCTRSKRLLAAAYR